MRGKPRGGDGFGGEEIGLSLSESTRDEFSRIKHIEKLASANASSMIGL